MECSLHLPSGAFLQASGEGADAYAAAEIAVEHLEKRLRRYKRRLKDHHNENKAGLPAEENNHRSFFRGNGRAVVLDEDEDDLAMMVARPAGPNPSLLPKR